MAWMMAATKSANDSQISTPVREHRTLDGRVLAEVLGLVSAEEALGLDLGGRTTGKFLVEADDTLHAQGIGSSANCLSRELSAFSPMIRSCFLQAVPHPSSTARPQDVVRRVQRIVYSRWPTRA